MHGTPEIKFDRIRPHHGSQDRGFEELVRQLVVADPPTDCARLEHKGVGADGGVELLAHLKDGSQVGYQAKYFTDTFGSAQVAQVRDSFRRAIAAYPALKLFIVAMPRNLSGGTARRTQRKLWERFVEEAEAEVRSALRDVKIELWDETSLIAQLIRPDAVHAGLRQYWFDSVVFTQAWLIERFRATQLDLGDRYLPDDHVDVSAQIVLDAVRRGPRWVAAVTAYREASQGLAKALIGLRVVGDAPAPDDIWQELADCHRALHDAADLLDFMAPGAIDLSQLTSAGKALRTSRAHEVFADLADTRSDRDSSDRIQRRRREAAEKFLDAVSSLTATIHDLDHEVLRQSCLLLLGEAGAGKSHSLAHMVEEHLAVGGPCLMFLGQHFAAGDPRAQIMGRIGLSALPFDTMLGALHTAALAAGKPGLIVIDAINEAQAPHLWSGSLSGLAADIARFPALSLVVSCRDVYEKDCVPANLVAARHYHEGFDGDANAAAKAYLDRHGIDRPAAPFYDPAFSNPLLLSTCVRRMVRDGLTAFPVGIEGIDRLFAFWLEGVEESLVRRGYARITRGDGRLRTALQRFADQLALEGVEALPIQQAHDLLETEVAKYSAAGPSDELLWRLLAEGVLRREPAASGGEAVAFTFQRFSDHFIADAVLRLYDSPTALAQALRPGGEMHHLVTPGDWRKRGIVEAIMAQTPERLGVELPDLEPNFTASVRLPADLFISSLRWRPATAVTTRTVQWFERLEGSRSRYSTEEFTILLQVATTPQHALNADYFHGRLSKQTLAERDAEWAPRFVGAMCDSAPADTLLDWALTARTDRADPERVRLAATVLAWFCLSPYRPLRDRATKALAAVFLRGPNLISSTIERFADVNDPYVFERVLAAALGACCHLNDSHPAQVEAAATAVDRAVFSRAPVTRHAYIRRYARRIVDLAAVHAGAPADRAARAEPPYASTPITNWPTSADLLPHQETAHRIIWSTVGHLSSGGDDDRGRMAGDFGRYVMASKVGDFSAVVRSAEPPLTAGEIRADFWSAVGAARGKLAELGEAARAALEAVNASRRKYSLVDIANLLRGTARQTAEEKADEEALRQASIATQAAFMAALPEGLKSHPGARFPFYDFGNDRVHAFSEAKAQRWVAWRALELGWSKSMHEEAERATFHSGDRHDHASERIGKKYQWIGYHELLGYFGDHHWFLAWDKTPEVLARMEALRETDIDPTYFEPDDDARPSIAPPALGLTPSNIPPVETVEAAIAWARSAPGLPRPELLVEGLDGAGKRWWLISSFTSDQNYYEKLQADGPTRSGQESIDMILMRPADIARLHELLSRKRANVLDLNDHSEPYERLFGEHRADLVEDHPQPLSETVAGMPFGRVSVSFSPKRGEYDHSGVPDGGFQVPRTWLLKALNLRPAGADKPWFVNVAGEPALVDPRRLDALDGRPIVNADLLEPVLDRHGLAPAWIVWAERDGGDGGGPHFNNRGKFTRETYAGLWWRENGTWRGSNWHVDENQISHRLDQLGGETEAESSPFDA